MCLNGLLNHQLADIRDFRLKSLGQRFAFAQAVLSRYCFRG
jgi:hypothetical protein